MSLAIIVPLVVCYYTSPLLVNIFVPHVTDIRYFKPPIIVLVYTVVPVAPHKTCVTPPVSDFLDFGPLAFILVLTSFSHLLTSTLSFTALPPNSSPPRSLTRCIFEFPSPYILTPSSAYTSESPSVVLTLKDLFDLAILSSTSNSRPDNLAILCTFVTTTFPHLLRNTRNPQSRVPRNSRVDYRFEIK